MGRAKSTMIYFFYGPDTNTSRERVRKKEAVYRKQFADAPILRLNSDTFSVDTANAHTSGPALFSATTLLILDHVFESADAKEFVLNKLKNFQTSDNTVVILEGVLNKKDSDTVKKCAEKTEYATKIKDREQQDRSVLFGITDAFGERDAKNMWVRYIRALREGYSSEEIHALLFWQVKAMLLLCNDADAKRTLKPFVLRKTERFLKNYDNDELHRMSWTLTSMLLKGRDSSNLNREVEKLALTL